MRYLIDTNIFLFLVLDKDMIYSNVSELLNDYSNVIKDIRTKNQEPKNQEPKTKTSSVYQLIAKFKV